MKKIATIKRQVGWNGIIRGAYYLGQYIWDYEYPHLLTDLKAEGYKIKFIDQEVI